jgi:hypothetical protein
MSWSVSLIGAPAKVIEVLDTNATKLRGESLAEYTEALPHLRGLVSLVVGDGICVKLSASGHASFSTSAVKTSGYISVALDQFYGLLV